MWRPIPHEVADLVRGMHVSIGGAEHQGESVVVGRFCAAVAAHEAHDGAAFTLAGVVQKVADDQSQMPEAPRRWEPMRWVSTIPMASMRA